MFVAYFDCQMYISVNWHWMLDLYLSRKNQITALSISSGDGWICNRICHHLAADNTIVRKWRCNKQSCFQYLSISHKEFMKSKRIYSRVGV